MFDMIHSWQKKNILKRNLLDFLDEMDKNLEIYYVMDQRQFITHGFQMEAWPKVKDLVIINTHPEIKVYISIITDFNKAYDEYKAFEQWYSSDMKTKNSENAKKLHYLKDSLQERIKNFEVIIIAAGQGLEKELLSLGFIEN